MRINVTPFGYTYEKGILVVNPIQKPIIELVFELAAKGNSLSQISSIVLRRYPETGINKNKVFRIIKDIRYVGDDVFDTIISRDLYDRANRIQTIKSTKSDSICDVELLRIEVPFKCPDCGRRMKRFHDSRRKCPERWKCISPDCAYQIRFSDVDMIDELKGISDNIQIEDVVDNVDSVRKSIPTARLELGIKNDLSTGSFEREKMRERILSLASMKYDDISDSSAKKSEIARSIAHYRDSYIDLINQVASEIQIKRDRTLTIVLKDGTKQRRLSENVNCPLRQGKEDNENCANKSAG